MSRLRLGGLWRHPDFVKLWLGRTVSEIGSGISGTALPLVALLTLGATPSQMGVLLAVSELPVLAVGLLAGVWVDRLRRRPLLIGADLGRALLIGVIPLAAWLGRLDMALLYGVAALSGALTVLFNTADQSYLPALVERDAIMEGNSKLASGSAVAEIGGPSLGGVLVQALTAPVAVLADALSFLVSAASLALIRRNEPPPPPPETRSGVRREIVEGLRVVWDDPLLRAVALSSATFNFFGGSFATLYSLYLVRDLGLPPAVLGALIGAGGIGALAGATLVERITQRVGRGPTLIGSLFLGTALQLLVPLTSGPPTVTIPILFLTQLTDVALAVFFINETTLRQQRVSDRLLGRATAALAVLTGGALALGALLAGALADTWGARPTLLLGSLGMIAAAAWMLASPVRGLRE
ncbi:MAG: MFS transporter [Chloroflexota bacterium]|nr:MFS transporter [Chloroflexota bacterium]